MNTLKHVKQGPNQSKRDNKINICSLSISCVFFFFIPVLFDAPPLILISHLLYIFKILLRYEPCYKQQKKKLISSVYGIHSIEHPLSKGSNYLYYIKIYSVPNVLFNKIMKNCISIEHGTFRFFNLCY